MAPILERIALVVGSNVAPSRVSQSLTLWVWMSLLQHPLDSRGEGTQPVAQSVSDAGKAI